MAQEIFDALAFPALGSLQEGERLAGSERIVQIAKIDAPDNLCGAHVGDEAPQRLARAARGQVPRRVHDRADGHVHDAFLRPEPTQLRVVGQAARETAEIRGDLIHVPPNHKVMQRRSRPPSAPRYRARW